MKVRNLIAVAALALGGLALAGPAAATPACTPPTGWYVNPDETENAPDQTPDGFKFEGKDLIHHATAPLDLADIKTHTGSFEATTAGKVLFKMETSNPYSSIIQNEDGKFWSTAMTYDQEGGQGHPVTNVSDLVGKPTKPGKPALTADTKVVTFGVGYSVETGSTVVSSITFHGTKYSLKCVPKPVPTTAKPVPTKTAPTTKAPVSTPPTSSTRPTLVPVGHPGTSLPVTGTPVGTIVALGLGTLAAGAIVLIAVRRRRATFRA